MGIDISLLFNLLFISSPAILKPEPAPGICIAPILLLLSLRISFPKTNFKIFLEYLEFPAGVLYDLETSVCNNKVSAFFTALKTGASPFSSLYIPIPKSILEVLLSLSNSLNISLVASSAGD